MRLPHREVGKGERKEGSLPSRCTVYSNLQSPFLPIYFSQTRDSSQKDAQMVCKVIH